MTLHADVTTILLILSTKIKTLNYEVNVLIVISLQSQQEFTKLWKRDIITEVCYNPTSAATHVQSLFESKVKLIWYVGTILTDVTKSNWYWPEAPCRAGYWAGRQTVTAHKYL